MKKLIFLFLFFGFLISNCCFAQTYITVDTKSKGDQWTAAEQNQIIGALKDGNFAIVARYLLILDATKADTAWIYDDGDTTRFESDNPIKVGAGSIVIDGDTLWVAGVKVENEGGCLATNDLHVHGSGGVAGYLKMKHGTTPTAHKEADHSILWSDSNNKLYYENPAGTDIEIGSIIADSIKVVGNSATLKLEDDSGNYGIIKVGNSQLTIEVDPDNAVASTDIVFKIDGVEVGRFEQGKGFQSKRGFATALSGSTSIVN